MAKKKTTSIEEWDTLKSQPEPIEYKYIKGSIHPDWHIFDGLFYPIFSAEDQFVIFNRVLLSWLERPQLGSGYNKNALDFYDGVIGHIIKTANYYCANQDEIWFPPPLADLMEIWQYQGVIYRIVDAPRSKIRYHKKIASWTKSVNAFNKFNLHKDSKYTFLIANTNGYYGFDTNEYNAYFNQGNPNILHEEEIIFPMDKKYLIAEPFYGTLDEFKAYVKQLNLIDNKD